jgi:hypothetical protein
LRWNIIRDQPARYTRHINTFSHCACDMVDLPKIEFQELKE